ncbi:MAG: hypothetical protein DI529_17750 [Chryseobacterium sp.]|nr:MAG: hypothetical protein DI529_17750 [Chryseobacterium sp.]
MKKYIFIFIVFVILIFLFFYFRYIYGWNEFKFYKETPKEYINNSTINKEKYSSDSASIVFQIQGFVEKHQESFYSKEYDKSTKIIVDTIIHSPDYKKIATFIIAKNSISKQQIPNGNYNWYYDATCYLGIKKQDSFLLSWIGPNYTNSYDMKDISKRIRTYFFKQRSSNPNNSDDKYNIDDIRYWNYDKDWQKIKK